MKITGITNYNYNKNKFQSKPNFKGTEYQYTSNCGSSHSGSGAYCEIYDKNGNVIKTGRESMYASGDAAVRQALRQFYPTNMNIYMNTNLQRRYEQKGTLYVADPEEGITEAMRQKYDFIATEERPSIPSLQNLGHKFHTLKEDRTNYNEQFKIATGYYSRLLKADLKTRNQLELKTIEDEDNLQTSLKNRDKYYFNHRQNPDNQDITDRLNTESYYVYQNEQNLRDNKEKYDYYTSRINDSKAKINFLTQAEEMLDRAGGMLMHRDVLANQFLKNKECAENAIIQHIDTDNAIKMKKAERKYYQEQLALIEEQKQKLAKQKFDGYETQRQILDRTVRPYNHEFKDKKEKCLARINELNKEIAGLKKSQIRTGQYLQKLRPQLEQDIQRIRAEIDKAEPIYQELKAHYENNNPF